jgi:hypothetical protein
MRVLRPWFLLLPWLVTAGTSDAEQAQAVSAELYRCRTANGGTAFVSKPDAALSDCVRVWNGTTTAPAPVSAPPSLPMPAPSEGNPTARHVETAEEHDARLQSKRDDILQWCRDRQDPKAAAKVKAKQLAECVQDKFGTYLLLNP